MCSLISGLFAWDFFFILSHTQHTLSFSNSISPLPYARYNVLSVHKTPSSSATVYVEFYKDPALYALYLLLAFSINMIGL